MDGIYVLRNDCTLMRVIEPQDEFPEIFHFCATVQRSQATKFPSREAAKAAIERYVAQGAHGGFCCIVIDFRPEVN